MWIRDGKKSELGSVIRNPEKHPGSATLLQTDEIFWTIFQIVYIPQGQSIDNDLRLSKVTRKINVM
jgi:hypothetical protein